jgi:hypothetical protein
MACTPIMWGAGRGLQGAHADRPLQTAWLRDVACMVVTPTPARPCGAPHEPSGHGTMSTNGGRLGLLADFGENPPMIR